MDEGDGRGVRWSDECSAFLRPRPHLPAALEAMKDRMGWLAHIISLHFFLSVTYGVLELRR